MAKKFKDYYNTNTARLIAEKIKNEQSSFDSEGFVKIIQKNIRGKAFLERQDVYVDTFEVYLGDNYSKNIALFTRLLGPELKTDTGMFTHGWWLWPIGRYVERHGLEDYDASLRFIYALTKRFTGEFAIRPLLKKHPKKTFRTLKKWSADENVHVRRLASEAMRISLPWTKKLLVAIEYFDEFRAVLENLKTDKRKFVQKSVGNNINDLMKIDPEKAWLILCSWERNNPTNETQWIIRHGTRSIHKYKKIPRKK
jgi:3-methyladenine DNA glycosylase AlkC